MRTVRKETCVGDARDCWTSWYWFRRGNEKIGQNWIADMVILILVVHCAFPLFGILLKF